MAPIRYKNIHFPGSASPFGNCAEKLCQVYSAKKKNPIVRMARAISFMFLGLRDEALS